MASGGAPCVLPFVYEGIEHEGCTKAAPFFLGTNPWCAIIVEDGEMSAWDYCAQDCPVEA